jgi:hypothetical protein
LDGQMVRIEKREPGVDGVSFRLHVVSETD